ncbi:hypothetical protein [Marinomonas aquiplantarum]|uniref:Uncharacterized protein n=1 Tax=Marinomonas aquiplantarum TaxID=491951 RepID=A0A366CXA9_9GAMM|nr:hypothetical protein [Marinomonas aquiplantarum]RBO81904.1 hypothetical protein DFP76_10747 [Marinomonas aquiplantarum]
MSDDIAFKIQLGLVLPKLDEQLKDPVTGILEEILDYLSKGTLPGEEKPTLEDVKALFMQDLDIFLDKTVLPAIDAKLNPPPEPVAEADGEAEGEVEEGAEADPEEVAEAAEEE